jgi:hypothetical protein
MREKYCSLAETYKTGEQELTRATPRLCVARLFPIFVSSPAAPSLSARGWRGAPMQAYSPCAGSGASALLRIRVRGTASVRPRRERTGERHVEHPMLLLITFSYPQGISPLQRNVISLEGTGNTCWIQALKWRCHVGCRIGCLILIKK